MLRYVLTSLDEASPATRSLYEDFMRVTGSENLPTYIQSLGHSPALLRAYWEKTKGCLIEGNLPLLLKEMVVFVVSRINGAEYCTACHAHAVLQLDKSLSYADLLILTESADKLQLTPAYRQAIAFATKVAQDARSATDEDFEALRQAGFTLTEIMELLAVIDLAVMFNTYTSGARLPIDPEYMASVQSA